MFHSIKSRFLLAFSLLAGVPLAVVGWFTADQSAATLERATGQELAAKARQASDTIDRNLFERYGDVQAFAYHPWARGSAAECVQAADFYARTYGIYDLLLIADRDGRIVACNTVDGTGAALDTSALIGRDVSAEPWFRACIGGETRPGETWYADPVFDPLVERVTGQHSLTLNFSAPIVDDSGQVVRVWSNRASWHRICDQVLEELRTEYAERGVTVETQILRKDGVLLSDADPESVLSVNLAQRGLESARKVCEGESGFLTEQDLRHEKLQINGFAASRGALGFPGYGWGVLVRMPPDDVQRVAAGIRDTIVLITGGALLLACLGAWWLASRMASPIVAASRAIDDLSIGALERQWRHDSRDELGAMAQSLESARATLQRLIRDLGELVRAAQEGQLDKRIDAASYQGGYGELCAGVNHMLDRLGEPLNATRGSLERLARGELTLESAQRFPGDWGEVRGSLQRTSDSVSELVAELERLIAATRDGRLGERAAVERFDGAYRQLCEGVNQMLDAVSEPVQASSRALERIARGELGAGEATNFRGDFVAIQSGLAGTRAAIQELVAQITRLSHSAAKGELDERADSRQLHGGYRELCASLNAMLDAMLGPVHEALTTLDALAARDLTVQMNGQYLGDHARVKDALNLAVAAMREALSDLSRGAASIGDSAASLTSISGRLAVSARQSASVAASTAQASEEVLTGNRNVSAAAVEMQASISEIAANAAQATSVVRTAVDTAGSARAAMGQLAADAQRVAGAVELIRTIAAQTNLLALNASIEAARAGEAGRGFAVVADEVKQLASQSAGATVEISQSIKAMHASTKSAEEALASIVQVVSEVDRISTSIAGAVEEQSATTRQISVVAADAVQRSSEIAANVQQFNDAARATLTDAEATDRSAAELQRLAAHLSELASSFRIRSETPPRRLVERGAA
ncbi:MAG: methyl-accepting chemotaxis protein [Planctomycetota bacterium]|nr:methyl-accepting chemotaxis protein [Planctomycetota bacterium]